MSDSDLDQALAEALRGFGAVDLEDVRALLAAGADPNVFDSEGRAPALSRALMRDDLALVRLLLEAGATPNMRWTATLEADEAAGLCAQTYEKLLAWDCGSEEMAKLLTEFGADPSGFDNLEGDYLSKLTGMSRIAPRTVPLADGAETFSPRHGTANPERYEPDFWIEQIRTGRTGYEAAAEITGRSRDVCGPPVWSFRRYGRTATRLPDGRWVLIAGEHEDHYDPDFWIYNDVTVLDGRGGVTHYVYPAEVFPPTDFHTATLMDDHILLVGSLGYRGRRAEGETQVLRLDLADFSVRRVATTGDNPGWINRHEAVRMGHELLISGGKVEPGYRDLEGLYALDTDRMSWRRVGEVG